MQDKQAEQWSADVDGTPREVVTASFDIDLEKLDVSRMHSHRKAQLLYTATGLLHCASGGTIWAVPSRCAIWIPGGQAHAVFASGDTHCYSICVEPDSRAQERRECCIIAVGSLLRELIVKACSMPTLYEPHGPEGRLISVLIDEIVAAPTVQLQLPMPRDPRLLKVVEAMLRDPAHRGDLDSWASQGALSVRSLSRLFRDETGMSLGDWRHRLHVVTAVGWLAKGRTVQMVAFDLGYSSASSFIKMFKGVLHLPPGRFTAESFSESASV